jgi:hypothetical protein
MGVQTWEGVPANEAINTVNAATDKRDVAGASSFALEAFQIRENTGGETRQQAHHGVGARGTLTPSQHHSLHPQQSGARGPVESNHAEPQTSGDL